MTVVRALFVSIRMILWLHDWNGANVLGLQDAAEVDVLAIPKFLADTQSQDIGSFANSGLCYCRSMG